MTPKTFGEVAVKALGIYSILTALQYVSAIITSYYKVSKLDGTLILSSNILSILIYLGAGRWLLVKSKSLSERYFSDEMYPDFPLTSEQFQSVLFSIVGVFLLWNSIPTLLQIIYRFLFLRGAKFDEIREELSVSEIQFIVVLVIWLLLALFLIFRSKSLAHFWSRVHSTSRGQKDSALIAEDQETDSVFPTAAERCRAILLSGIGLYMVCYALPKLAGFLYAYLFAGREDLYGIQQQLARSNLGSSFEQVVWVLLGLFLIFGTQKFKEYWRRLRPMSMRREETLCPSEEDEENR